MGRWMIEDKDGVIHTNISRSEEHPPILRVPSVGEKIVLVLGAEGLLGLTCAVILFIAYLLS